MVYNEDKKETFLHDHQIFGFWIHNFNKETKPKIEESYDFYYKELMELKSMVKPDNFIRMSIGTNMRQTTNVTTFFQQILV